MKNLRKRSILIFLGFIVILCICMTIIEVRSRVLRRIIDDKIYDNKYHYISCEKLPSLSEVEKTYSSNIDVIRRIEEVNPGLVGAEIQSPYYDKGDILFWYGSHKDRIIIERIIGSETF